MSPRRTLLALAAGGLAAAGACSALAAVAPVAAAGTPRSLAGVAYAHADAGHPYVETPIGGRRSVASVWSPSMATDVPVVLQSPANGQAGAPVMYQLSGSTGGEDGDDWTHATDTDAFFGDKNVWTATPIGGAASYYADWRAVDPAANFRFGVTTDRPLRWETFLTDELPRALEGAHGGYSPGRSRGIAGISMSGNSVLRIAENHPGFYRAVGSYSGCADMASVPGQLITRIVAFFPGAADASNMYGPPWDPEWARQDPVINAPRLADRTPALWVSAGNGLPGAHDTLQDPRIAGNVGALAQQVTIGGLDEAATLGCTAAFARRLAALRIPATVRFTPNGTHSWGYWQDQMHDSWPTFAPALGV